MCLRAPLYSAALSLPSESRSISWKRDASRDCAFASSLLIEPSPFLSSVAKSGHWLSPAVSVVDVCGVSVLGVSVFGGA